MWSFGKDNVSISDFGKHNVLIGKNNAGKSKVIAGLRWLKEKANAIAHNESIDAHADMFHESGDGRVPNPLLSIVFDISDIRTRLVETIVTELERNPLRGAIDGQIGNTVEVKVSAQSLEALKASINVSFPGVPHFEAASYLGESSPLNPPQLVDHWKSAQLTIRRHLIEKEIGTRIQYVGGWRTLRAKVEGDSDLVKCLHVWRDPAQNQKHLRHRFTNVQSIFRRLMLNQELELRPENTGQNLMLASGGTYLPIESYGDGVQHLLMIAFYLATAPDSVLLIEEPETHLHPELQRNLVHILRQDLKGQAFITTHSPVLLDAAAVGGKIYRVERSGSYSSIHRCDTSSDIHKTLDDLDVRASDLLQANLVIWVEGPTDRMFINRCLQLMSEEDLTEGVQYQFAYYGGRLRSHVTFDEFSAEFVNLMKLSRHVVMVCDSDKKGEGDKLDASKLRLKEECEKCDGLYWVTDGREIENYIPDEVLTGAFRDLLNDSSVSLGLGRYDKLDDVLIAAFPNPEHGDGWKVAYDENKTRVMPKLLSHLTPDDLTRWGLDKRLAALLERIKKANPA